MRQREPRLQSRSTPVRCLDDDRRLRKPRHHGVAQPKRLACGLSVREEGRDDRALASDLFLERGVLRRIAAGDPGTDYRDAPAAASQCGPVSRGIDPGCQARDDRVPAVYEFLREVAGGTDALRGGGSRADDGDRSRVGGVEPALEEDQRRAIVNLAEVRGVIGVEHRKKLKPSVRPEPNLLLDRVEAVPREQAALRVQDRERAARILDQLRISMHGSLRARSSATTAADSADELT